MLPRSGAPPLECPKGCPNDAKLQEASRAVSRHRSATGQWEQWTGAPRIIAAYTCLVPLCMCAKHAIASDITG